MTNVRLHPNRLLQFAAPYWISNRAHTITRLGLTRRGVTTSRATSGGWRKDRNTSGQRVNKFNNSYSHISVIVAENNSLLKPKCQQYISLNKMLSNLSKVLMAHVSFTAKQWRYRRFFQTADMLTFHVLMHFSMRFLPSKWFFNTTIWKFRH